jgi:hypothetical protein
MTPNELNARVGAVVDRLARSFASDEAMTPALDRLQRNLIAQYGAAFPDAKPSGVAALVDLIIGGVRSRRAEIEASGQAL